MFWYNGNNNFKDLQIINNKSDDFPIPFHEPNEITFQALKEAKEGNTESPIDTGSVEAILKSMEL